jgi:hypothetical protein
MKRRLPGGGWTDDAAAYCTAWEKLAEPCIPPGWTLTAYNPDVEIRTDDLRQKVTLTPDYCRAMAAWRKP